MNMIKWMITGSSILGKLHMFSVTIHIPSLVPDPSARHVEPQLMRSLRELPQLRFAAQPLVQQREVQPTVALRFGAGEVEV